MSDDNTKQEEQQQPTQQQPQPTPIPNVNAPPFHPQASKEIKLTSNETSKRAMFLIKEFLQENEYVDVTSGTSGSPTCIRASESLVRLGYVTYDKVKTDTTLLNGRRRTKLIVRLKRTENFKALYEENEAIRKKTQEIDNTF
jgi:hypothetical protein